MACVDIVQNFTTHLAALQELCDFQVNVDLVVIFGQAKHNVPHTMGAMTHNTITSATTMAMIAMTKT